MMLKKIMPAVVLTGASVLAPLAFAAAPASSFPTKASQPAADTAHTTTLPMPTAASAAVPVTAVRQGTGFRYAFASADNHAYVNLSFLYEYFKSADFGVGSPDLNGVQRTAKASGKISQWTKMPKIAMGFQFNNNFLSSFFGQHASVEADFSFFNTNSAAHQGNLGEGAIWAINGSGFGPARRGNVPIPAPRPYDLHTFTMNAQTKYRSAGVYFRGNNVTSNPALTMSPFVGLVYTYLTQDYQSVLNYEQNFNDILDESVTTKYYGFSFGNNLSYTITNQLHWFTNIEVQLLQAISQFSGYQNINDKLPVSAHGIFHVNNSHRQNLTYRATLSTGLSLAFTHSPASASINVGVGVDQWGYMPEIYNPRGAADKTPARVVNSHETNPIASVSLNIPLV